MVNIDVAIKIKARAHIKKKSNEEKSSQNEWRRQIKRVSSK